MNERTAWLFTRAGLGEGPAELQRKLTAKFLDLLLESGGRPGWVLLYTDGVKLACKGSPVQEQLQALASEGTEVILCQTCLDYYGLTSDVAVGTVGGMPAILEAMDRASKVIAL